MTKLRRPTRPNGPGKRDTPAGGFGVVLAILLITSFIGAVVINYYLWNWIAPMFGWPEIRFWWFVPITLVLVPLKFLINALFHFMFFGDDAEGDEE